MKKKIEIKRSLMLWDNHNRPCKELRVLPLNRGANLIVSIQNYTEEMQYRKEINKKLSKNHQWDFPNWEDLEVYAKED